MSEPRIAVFAALADEIRITRSKMQIDESIFMRPAKILRGSHQGSWILLVQSGVGANAMSAAVAYCAELFKPDLCINVGFCGGAVPDVQVADSIIADRVVDADSGDVIRAAPDLVDKAVRLCERLETPCRRGGIAMVDHVISDPHDKAFIGTAHEVCALDMESYAFAKACVAVGCAWLVVRAVFDSVDTSLPDLGGAVDREGETDMFGVVKRLLRHPRDIIRVPRLEYCAVQAREAIARFIDAWFADRPPA